MPIDFATVVERDRGLRQIRREMRRFASRGGRDVLVGFTGKKARAIHKPGYRATNVEIAMFHEFGTKNIPRRSMIGGWAQEKRREIFAVLGRQTAEVLEGKRKAGTALARIGVWAVGSIQARMGQGIPPPLADSTKKRRKKPKRRGRKGQSGQTPLIDTGQLRASIAYRVSS